MDWEPPHNPSARYLISEKERPGRLERTMLSTVTSSHNGSGGMGVGSTIQWQVSRAPSFQALKFGRVGQPPLVFLSM